MLNDVKPPPPAEPADPNRPATAGPVPISATHGPGAVAPTPSIRPDEVTRPVDPAAPDSGHVPRSLFVQPHAHVRAEVDPVEPGLHKSRAMGERTPTDAIYAMPLEDRGSTFSVGLSIVVIVIFTVLVLTIWLSLR